MSHSWSPLTQGGAGIPRCDRRACCWPLWGQRARATWHVRPWHWASPSTLYFRLTPPWATRIGFKWNTAIFRKIQSKESSNCQRESQNFISECCELYVRPSFRHGVISKTRIISSSRYSGLLLGIYKELLFLRSKPRSYPFREFWIHYCLWV